MKTITMTLDPKSIRSAINELKAYKKALQESCVRACRRLGELGVVSATFNAAACVGDRDFKVLPLQGREGVYQVVADGEDVAFVEFGTGEGVAYPPGYPQDSFADKVYAGSWSQEFEGCFSKHGFWHYGGELYFGTGAGMIMYQASVDMRENIIRIFKEEFAW